MTHIEITKRQYKEIGKHYNLYPFNLKGELFKIMTFKDKFLYFY